MSHSPEPRLDPPAGVVVGVCCCCEDEIYEGERVWKRGYLFACKHHMDEAMAEYEGYVESDGRE